MLGSDQCTVAKHTTIGITIDSVIMVIGLGSERVCCRTHRECTMAEDEDAKCGENRNELSLPARVN